MVHIILYFESHTTEVLIVVVQKIGIPSYFYRESGGHYGFQMDL